MAADKHKKKSIERFHIENPYEDGNIKVHFIGTHLMDRYDEISYHYNPGYEICIISQGKGIFKINQKSFPIGCGQIFMTKPSEFHGGWPSREEPYEILYICFSIKETGDPFWQSLDGKLCNNRFPITCELYNIKEVHKSLLWEVQNNQPFKTEIIGCLLKQYITLTARNFSSYGEKDGLDKISLSTKIIHYIDEHIKDNVSLDDISMIFKYSIPYMCRSFKKETGYSIMEYYNLSRIEQSRMELLNTEKPISQISEEFVFSSIHHYSNAFKNVYDSSPSDYRRKHKFINKDI